MTASLPATWKRWVLENLLKGVAPAQILRILLENGFTFEASKKALGDNLPSNLTHPKDAAFYQRICHPSILDNLADSGAEYLESERAQLLRLDSFMSPTECEEIIKLSKTRLRPSEISAKSGYDGFRTSTTCDLPYLHHPAADAVDQKIIQCLGVGVGENEVIQAQHYAIGQEFKAHTDYFEPGSDEYKTYCKQSGQRTWTFMVYLNDVVEGGETEFPQLGLSFKPRAGTALIWNNLHPDGTVNPATLHQAHPVTKGEKVVITKWFREQAY